MSPSGLSSPARSPYPGDLPEGQGSPLEPDDEDEEDDEKERDGIPPVIYPWMRKTQQTGQLARLQREGVLLEILLSCFGLMAMTAYVIVVYQSNNAV